MEDVEMSRQVLGICPKTFNVLPHQLWEFNYQTYNHTFVHYIVYLQYYSRGYNRLVAKKNLLIIFQTN